MNREEVTLLGFGMPYAGDARSKLLESRRGWGFLLRQILVVERSQWLHRWSSCAQTSLLTKEAAGEDLAWCDYARPRSLNDYYLAKDMMHHLIEDYTKRGVKIMNKLIRTYWEREAFLWEIGISIPRAIRDGFYRWYMPVITLLIYLYLDCLCAYEMLGASTGLRILRNFPSEPLIAFDGDSISLWVGPLLRQLNSVSYDLPATNQTRFACLCPSFTMVRLPPHNWACQGRWLLELPSWEPKVFWQLHRSLCYG